MMDVAGDDVCLFAKENSPYECKKSGPPDTLTRLSLFSGRINPRQTRPAGPGAGRGG